MASPVQMVCRSGEPYTREGGTMMILDTEPDLVHHHDWVLMELLAPDYTY